MMPAPQHGIKSMSITHLDIQVHQCAIELVLGMDNCFWDTV